jgi:hypothetical protein
MMKNSTWPTSLFRRCARWREIFFKIELDKFHRKSLPEGEGKKAALDSESNLGKQS